LYEPRRPTEAEVKLTVAKTQRDALACFTDEILSWQYVKIFITMAASIVGGKTPFSATTWDISYTGRFIDNFVFK